MIHAHQGPDLPDGLTSPDVDFTPGYGRAATVSDVGECLRELGVISVLLRHSPLVPQAPQLPWQQSAVRGHPTIIPEPSEPKGPR